MPAPALHEIGESLGRIEALDPVARPLGKEVRRLVPAGPVKDALSGTWLGHALHPLLTDVPIGAWTSALVLDAVGGPAGAPAAETLVGVGLAAAVPTVVTGFTEWADSEVGDASVRRMGLVHATANAAAAGLYTASLLARRSGDRGRGIAYGLAGAAVLGVGGFLGGHLSYAKGVGVDQTAFTPPPEDWHDVADAAAVPEGGMTAVEVEGAGVLVARRDGRLHAIADRCSHRGAPLHEGELIDGCVQCPWHGSRFALEDGGVVRGPASNPQPRYGVRERAGRIEVGPAG